MAKREQASQAPVIDDEALDRDPAPDPEWLAGLPPDVRKAHDRFEQERAKLQRAHDRKYAMIDQARRAQTAEIGVAREMRDKATEAVEEEYRAALSRTDASYRQARQAATEQYDHAQMQYDQALRAWHDAHSAYIAGAVKEG